MKYRDIEEATRAWVREFNAFPLSMIEKLFEADMNDWQEITPIAEGCVVWSYEYNDRAEVIEITTNEDDEDVVIICLDGSGEEVKADLDDLILEEDSYFPMWGTMWSFSDSADDWWLENNLGTMANCGFRIYESEEFGYFFGIDGAGYDFYEEHWIPLYKARGLMWHETDELV